MHKKISHTFPLIRIDDYAKFVPSEQIERIYKKAEYVKGMHLTNISSTYYGGGVAEILSSLTTLMNSLGLMAGWRTIQGNTDFFNVTKKMHNALQGSDIHLTDRKKEIYENINFQNALRNHIRHDFVIVHDPQPLPMIEHYIKKGPWIWRCHIDMTNPNPQLWNYLKPFIEQYDAAVLSLQEYKQDLTIPQIFFMPAIDPFSPKNMELTEAEMTERLNHYHIPTDLPLIVQISRYDKWKDPQGVIQAFKLARKDVKATLVLLGGPATDDPEGPEIYESILNLRDERVIVLSQEDSGLVNTLQRKAHVILQKSLREGFGLTVTEAMWKGTPVIGGNVGGIRHQIQDGVNGFLVDSVEQTAERIIQLIKNPKLRDEMGKKAQDSVKKNFLMIRKLEQYIDLFNSFQVSYKYQPKQSVL